MSSASSYFFLKQTFTVNSKNSQAARISHISVTIGTFTITIR